MTFCTTAALAPFTMQHFLMARKNGRLSGLQKRAAGNKKWLRRGLKATEDK